MTDQEISLGKIDNSVDTRERLNVNSPKGKANSSNHFAVPPMNLITSVKQGDEERQKQMAKQMAGNTVESGVSNDSAPELSGRHKGYASCFSCWLCCGSKSKKDSGYPAKSPEENSMDDDGDINTIVVSNEQMGETESKVVTVDQSDEYKPIEEESYASESGFEWLLNSVHPSDKGRKCLVLDLDETLVHSSFQPVDCSFAISIELDGTQYGVSVLKRPFVDEFITECAKLYELVIFTASLAEYANPVIDKLDRRGLIKSRLFRESCVFHEGKVYVKDLSRLGRDLKDCIIIDNSPLSYLFHPKNAIGCTSWFGDESDTELRDLLPVLGGQLLNVSDVRTILDANSQSCEWLIKNYGNTKDNCEQINTE